MLGTLLSAGTGVLGGLAGGAAASGQNNRIMKNLRNQLRENQAWYDRRYNEDATQRADAQAVLSATQESIRNRNRAAAGTRAVAGGTDESVAAAREANNQALSSAAGAVNAQGVADKASVENAYLQNKQQLNAQLNANRLAQANNIAGAVTAATNDIREAIK